LDGLGGSGSGASSVGVSAGVGCLLKLLEAGFASLADLRDRTLNPGPCLLVDAGKVLARIQCLDRRSHLLIDLGRRLRTADVVGVSVDEGFRVNLRQGELD